MKPTKKSTNGTSFHNSTIVATVSELIKVLGDPAMEQNTGEDKVNYEWEMETSEGEVFTVYDWKEYRPIKENEEIVWHIGSHEARTSFSAAEEIDDALKLV